MDINSVASSPLGWPVELLNSARAHHALELTKGAYTQKLIEYRKTLLDAVAEAERGLASDAADPAGSLAKLQDIRQTAAAIMEQALDIREDLVAQSDDLGIAPGETTAFLRSASLTANHHFGTAAGNDHLTSTLEHAATKLTQTIDAQRLTEQAFSKRILELEALAAAPESPQTSVDAPQETESCGFQRSLHPLITDSLWEKIFRRFDPPTIVQERMVETLDCSSQTVSDDGGWLLG